MMEENVSQRINRLREQEELGVYELARMVNVSARTVYEWEKGVVDTVEEAVLTRLAPVLGVTKYYLRTGVHRDILSPEVEAWLRNPENMEKFMNFYYKELGKESCNHVNRPTL